MDCRRWMERTLLLVGMLLASVPALRAQGTPGQGSPHPEAGAAPAPLTWENLEERMRQEAANGFAGSILVVRNGETVLDEGYGLANRAKKIPDRPDTIYAIGSTPIDFTRAGILLLAQQGKLDLSDPITKYFKNVPKDKRPITLEMLMTGRSGLANFHDRPTDSNPDHQWIDRDEAMRRIFEGKLLFPPGKGERHSHSAWGVLAAVLEIVSGQSYPDFTREHLFGPAGMKDTAFFGEPYPEDRMAIGYGDRASGKINAPPYWGPTSWLVMGSGGQTSTTGDMLRWHRALAAGKILNGEWLDRYWAPPGAVLAGGDMFGFEIIYTQGPETMMVLVSNDQGHGSIAAFQRLGGDLAGLVNQGSLPKFSLGIRMDVDPDGRVVIAQVMPGSAAERDGLQAGDVLLSAGGRPLGDDPIAVLGEYLDTGRPIPFEIERDGARRSLTVTPAPR